MKKITRILSLILFTLLASNVNAQDGYTYTLIDNGGYNYTIAAVPNASSNNFATSVQSYGFTIILSDGNTASLMSSLGGAASATPFDGNAVGQPTIDGYLITETLGAPASLPAPSAGTTTPIVTIQMAAPTVPGSISILENNSTLATTVTPLKSFMQADMIDNGMAEFVNVVDPNAAAVTAPSSYNFSTLSTTTQELTNVSIFPNPATDVVYIKGLRNDLKSIELFNMAGQKVLSATNNLETINVANLEAGVYFVKLNTEAASKTIKLTKKK